MPVIQDDNALKPHQFYPSRGRTGYSGSTSASSSSSVVGGAAQAPIPPASPSNFEDADSEAMDQDAANAATHAAATAASAAIAQSGISAEILQAITTAISASIVPTIDLVANNVLHRFMQQQQQQQPQQQQQQQPIHAHQAHASVAHTLPPRTPKLSSFDAANVALWLGSAATEFEICRVTDPATKRAHILAAIPTEHKLLFQEFLLNPDATEDGYLSLINHIRLLFEEKPRQRAARILRPHNLNERTPSQFLAALKAEMANMTLDMIAKEILAGVLPPHIRAIVTTDTNAPADMAAAADCFFTSSGELIEQNTVRPICTANAAPPPQQPAWDDEPEEEHAPPTPTPTFPATPPPAYANVAAAYRGPQRSRARPPPRTSRHQPQNNQRQNHSHDHTAAPSNSPNLCFYHRRFGDEARNCREGCPRWGNARAGSLQ